MCLFLLLNLLIVWLELVKPYCIVNFIRMIFRIYLAWHWLSNIPTLHAVHIWIRYPVSRCLFSFVLSICLEWQLNYDLLLSFLVSSASIISHPKSLIRIQWNFQRFFTSLHLQFYLLYELFFGFQLKFSVSLLYLCVSILYSLYHLIIISLNLKSLTYNEIVHILF